MILPSSVVQKLDEVRTSLVNVNQELMLVGYNTGIEGATYRLSQIINVNIGTLTIIMDDLQGPKNEAKIIRDDFGIFEHLLPAELVEYKKIEDEKHKIFCWRFLENRKFEILRSVKDRLAGRGE